MRSVIHRIVGQVPAGVRLQLKRLPGASWLRDQLYGTPRGPDPEPGQLRPIVYLPTWLKWDQMPQRPQFMLEAFARRGHEVWVVQPTLTSPRQAGERIRLVGSVRDVPRRHVILYTHFAPLVTLIDRFESPSVVYDLMDDLTIYDDDEVGLPEERRVRHHHASMTEKTDVFVVSNSVLEERHVAERPDLVRVENGVDLARFRKQGPVAEVLHGRSYVVGYHGAIAQWFDFAMVQSLAGRNPDLTFVLVGPLDPRAEADLGRLTQLPNVEHVKEQPGDLIPTFVRGFHVGFIPFVVNQMTEGVTPLKMYEYMACGVPVVASPLPACVDHPAVFTAEKPDILLEGIKAGLSITQAERERLVDFAREASWDKRIEPLIDRLDELGHLSVPGVG